MTDDRIKVESWGGVVTVTFTQNVLTRVPPDPRLPPPPPDFVYEYERVEEPNWFMRLLGDSLEHRIERAMRKVTERATEQITRRERANRAALEAICAP